MRTITFTFAVVLALVGASFLGVGNAHAAVAPSNDQGVQISPTVVSVNADPSQTVSFDIGVMNVTAKTLVFSSAINDFSAKDESGTPLIDLNSTLPPTVSMRTWAAPIAPFTLKPYETKKITVSFTVPANAEGGGHYGVVRFSGTDSANTTNGVAVNVSAGALVLMRVSGNILEHLSVATFTTTANGNQQSVFEQSPVTFETRLTDDGTVHLQPTGSIDITDMFGRKVTSLSVNDKKGFILPHSTRRFESTLNKDWLFGKYTADLTLAYGTTGGAVERTISFWMIPFKLIGIIVLILLILGAIVVFSLKRYKQRIIKKYKRE